jgi:hypothetical protein
VEEFSVKLAFIVPLFDPLAGETVNHDALSLTVQVVFDEIENVVLPDVNDTCLTEGDTVNDNEADACDTVTVLVKPPPLIVIVPTR